MVKAKTKGLHPELPPMTDCPRFNWCSAPICPLDRDMAKRSGPFGKEPSCRLPKATRIELGKDVPWRGLWPPELATTKRWEDKTPEQRETVLEQLALSRTKSSIAHGPQS